MLFFRTLKVRVFYLLIFMGLVLMVQPVLGQNEEHQKKRVIAEIDSLYKLIYTFNFTDLENNGDTYRQFPELGQELAERSLALNFDQGYFKSQNMVFLYYKFVNDIPKAFEIADNAIIRAKRENKPKYEAQFIYLKGIQFNRYDDYDSAITYMEKAYGIAESANYSQVMGAAINAMAAIFSKLRKYDQSLYYYRKALPIAQKAGDSLLIATLHGNLGLTHARFENGDSAIYYGKSQLGMAERTKNPRSMRQSLNVLTMGSFLTGKYDDVITYSDRLYDIVAPTQDLGFMITPYLYRAKSWKAKGQIDLAIKEVSESIRIAREIDYPSGESRSLEWLIALNEELGAYEKAFNHLERLVELKDTEKEEAAIVQLDKMALRYELKEKDVNLRNMMEVQKETGAKIKFRNLMIACVALIFLIIVGLTVLIYRRKVEKQKMKAQESQNRLLRSQLNPHFLFNALSSIQLFLINKGQVPEALEYLSKFAKLMRRILENSRESFVSLEDEISTLRHYLDLQKIRFDNKFDYHINVNIKHGLEDIMIPPMFAQPFIENSLEHGIAKREDGEINVWFEETEAGLSFRVEDNGIGVELATKMKSAKEHRSLATVITQDRITLLRKQLRKKVSFAIRDRRDEEERIVGTEVVFELPVIYRYS